MIEYTIMDMAPMLRRLWRNKWILALLTLAGLLAGLAYTANDEAELRYTATSSVCVTYTTYQEQMRGSSVITSYADLVSSMLVCERAAELLADTGLTAPEVQEMVNNYVSSNSYVMYISATADEAELAIRVTNAVAVAFTEKVSGVAGTSSLQILDVAYEADAQADSSLLVLIIATLAPLMLALAWLVIKELLADKIRTLAQCAPDPDELLGVLPELKQRRVL